MLAEHRNQVGASAEIIEHHDRLHRARCPSPHEARDVICPCGTTVAIVCGACGEPVFGAVVPGTWCRHAVELLGPVPEVAA